MFQTFVSSNNGRWKDQTKRRWIASAIQPISGQICEESAAVSSVGVSPRKLVEAFGDRQGGYSFLSR